MGQPSVTAILILVGFICQSLAQNDPSGRQPSQGISPRVLRLPDSGRPADAAIRRRFQGNPRRLRINEGGGFVQADQQSPEQPSQTRDAGPQSQFAPTQFGRREPQIQPAINGASQSFPNLIEEPDSVRAIRQGALSQRRSAIPTPPPPVNPASNLASLLGLGTRPGNPSNFPAGSFPSLAAGNLPPNQFSSVNVPQNNPSRAPISRQGFQLPTERNAFSINPLLSRGAAGILSQPPNPLLNPLSANNVPIPTGSVAGDLTSSPQQNPLFNFPNAGQFGVDSPGLLGVLTGLARQVTEASGLSGILDKQGGAGGLPSIPGVLRSPANSFPGFPANAGLPSLPGLDLGRLAGLPSGALGQSGRNVDLIPLITAITNRVTNGSSLASVLPPNRLQGFADNITESLLPETAGVDLNKFMGRWFEGINSPRASEQRCVVHHYGGLTENGKTATYTALKIYRDGSEYGQVRYSIGYAFRGGHKDGMLQMHTSETADPVPYWIYKLGPEGTDPFGNAQYEYAIISNWVRYPVTVLVRDPDSFKKNHEVEVLRWLEDQNFINGFIRAFNLLQPSNYENCQYADSTFEVFG